MAGQTAAAQKRHAKPSAPAGVEHHAVAQVAYGLYEQRGRAPGFDVDDWLKAEAIICSRTQRNGR